MPYIVLFDKTIKNASNGAGLNSESKVGSLMSEKNTKSLKFGQY